MSIMRRLDFRTCLQFSLEVIQTLERMELETVLLALIGVLLLPFIVTSLWTLGMTLIWQLLWLGFKFGMILFVVASVFMTCIGLKNRMGWRTLLKGGLLDGAMEGDRNRDAAAKPKCTLLDAVLSIFFHTGLRLPAFLWEVGMELYLREGDKPSAREVAVAEMLKELEQERPRPSFAETLWTGLMSPSSRFGKLTISPRIVEEATAPVPLDIDIDDEFGYEFNPDLYGHDTRGSEAFSDHFDSIMGGPEADIIVGPAPPTATPIRASRRRRSGTVKKRTTRSSAAASHHHHHQMY